MSSRELTYVCAIGHVTSQRYILFYKTLLVRAIGCAGWGMGGWGDIRRGSHCEKLVFNSMLLHLMIRWIICLFRVVSFDTSLSARFLLYILSY